MAVSVRDRIPELAGVLSLLSLALIFATALGYVPRTVVPRLPPSIVALLPHLNAMISLIALVVIALGWRWIRQGRIARHRRAMITGLVLFATFLVSYLYKLVLKGPATFPGPEFVYQFAYLPLLTIHVSLAVVCVPLLYYVALLAATRPVSEIPGTRHPRIGRIAVGLWLTSFALGLVVYLLLYVLY